MGKRLSIFLLFAILLSACSSNLPSKNILFIGNSFTNFNGGLDRALKGLAPNAKVKRISPGGYTLQDHWQSADTLEEIRSGDWDIVVLQDQSQNPVVNYFNFYEYAGKLDQEIKNAGAETVLFMTWERPDSVQFGVTTKALSNSYTVVGNALGANVAPVGIAFSAARQQRPDVQLFIEDGHPTAQGTYLAACVFFGVIYGQSPAGNSYRGKLSAEESEFLQSIAAATLGY